MRAPFQILVIPYRYNAANTIEYCIFNRADANFYQGISGGGEDKEQPIETARREIQEEAGLVKELIPLQSLCMIPVTGIRGFIWGPDVLVVPEYCFGVKIESGEEIHLSDEHTHCEWLPYNQAHEKLKWDSNKTALWELNHRLVNKM